MTLTTSNKRSDIATYVLDSITKGKTPYIVASTSGNYVTKLNLSNDDGSTIAFSNSVASGNTSVKLTVDTCKLDGSSLRILEYVAGTNTTSDITSNFSTFKLYY